MAAAPRVRRSLVLQLAIWALCCGSMGAAELPGLIALQLATGDEPKPSPAELEKIMQGTQKEIDRVIAKDKQDEDERERQLGHPSAEEKAAAVATNKTKLQATYDAERKSNEAQEGAEQAIDTAGEDAQKHLANLENLVKKSDPDVGTLASMESQGALLVKALLRPKKTKAAPAPVPNVAVRERDAASNADAQKEAKAEERAERLKVEMAKKEAKKVEKFKSVLRIEKRDAKSEYDHAMKEAVIAKTKAKSVAAEHSDKRATEAELVMAQQNSKIATIKEKLAEQNLEILKTKLKAARQDSRAAAATDKRRKETLNDLHGQEVVFGAKAKAEKAKLDAAVKEQQKEKSREVREKILNGDHAAMVHEEESARQLQREADRDKVRMMQALKASKNGNNKDVRKFEQMKERMKNKQSAAKARKMLAKAARKKMYLREIKFAQEDFDTASSKVQDATGRIAQDRKDIENAIQTVRKSTSESEAQLKAARQSGNKALSDEAQDALAGVKEDVKDQQRLELQLVNDKRMLKDAERERRVNKRALKKAKDQLKPKSQGETMKSMEDEVQRAETAAAEASREASTTERIMRTQAKVDVRKEVAAVNDQKAEVEDLRMKLDRAKTNVKQKSRRAERATEEYMVLIKAAGVDDGDRLLKVSHKVAKRLRALDKNEHFEAEIMQNYDNATIKLGNLKKHERHATKVAYDILQKRVKIKTAELQKKKDKSNEMQLKKDDDASYEPRKYVQLAEVSVRSYKEHLQQARDMKAKAQADLNAQRQVLMKLPKDSAARDAIKLKVRKAHEVVEHWEKREAIEEKGLGKAEKMLESRKHLARVAVAVYRHHSGAPSELMDEELEKTKQLFKAVDHLRSEQNRTLEESIDQDAHDITKLVLSPGGSRKVEAIMSKAVKANKEGVGLDKTIGFINRKLDEQGWGPSLKESDSDGLSRKQYDDRELAIQQANVANGMYGHYAKLKMKHLLKQVDEGEDPGTPRHGISRAELAASERADKKSLRDAKEKVASKLGPLPHDVNDLEEIVNTIHAQRGMTREQFDAASEAITGRRISLGTPNADRIDRERAAGRLKKINKSWQRYEKQMAAVTAPDRSAEDEDLEWQRHKMNHDFRKGTEFFDSQYNLAPDDDDVDVDT